MAPIASAILAPFVGAATAIWTLKTKDKERFDVALEWGWATDINGQEEECPVAYVHNRSDRPIAVIAVHFIVGGFRRRRVEGTAINYTDPRDISFPYLINSGHTHRFWIDEYMAIKLIEKLSFKDKIFRLLCRWPLYLEVKTMANTRKLVPAHRAAPWKHRPEWLK